MDVSIIVVICTSACVQHAANLLTDADQRSLTEILMHIQQLIIPRSVLPTVAVVVKTVCKRSYLLKPTHDLTHVQRPATEMHVKASNGLPQFGPRLYRQKSCDRAGNVAPESRRWPTLNVLAASAVPDAESSAAIGAPAVASPSVCLHAQNQPTAWFVRCA